MSEKLRYNIADQRLAYTGLKIENCFDYDRILEFNHRHRQALQNYDIEMESCSVFTLCDKINGRSNLGALRNRKVRQSVILSAALSAISVGVNGCGALNNYPEEEHTKGLKEALKRANDRTAAHVMSEVLQTTTEQLPVGEEVIIESTITEGVRVKPGKEAGGNPTIAVGAVFGKQEHRKHYGLSTTKNVTLLSMGNDVIDGTTKSITGTHSSLTALFVTESHIKRHLPDIYVQRWMSAAPFEKFNAREATVSEAAEIIGKAYGLNDLSKLSTFFLDRPRHYPAMDELNKMNIATPFDKDGDLLPAIVMGMDGLMFPDKRGLMSMIGEIGGSAEWAVGVLPLVWRGGQALGMLTSQSALTRKDLTPEELWAERFHFTEDEFMQIQDARFERKPYFTIEDIVEDPFAGGISAFGAITDNYYIPFLKGVTANPDKGTIDVNVLTVNSLGVVEGWMMTFKCQSSYDKTVKLMSSPKDTFVEQSGKELEKTIGNMLADENEHKRFRLFFNNEYYPAIIPIRDKMVLLHRAVETLIDRGALTEKDREIIDITERLAPEWFTN